MYSMLHTYSMVSTHVHVVMNTCRLINYMSYTIGLKTFEIAQITEK